MESDGNKIPTSAEELKRRRGRSWFSVVNRHRGVNFQNVSNYTDRTVLPPKSSSIEMLPANPPKVQRKRGKTEHVINGFLFYWFIMVFRNLKYDICTDLLIERSDWFSNILICKIRCYINKFWRGFSFYRINTGIMLLECTKSLCMYIEYCIRSNNKCKQLRV